MQMFIIGNDWRILNLFFLRIENKFSKHGYQINKIMKKGEIELE